MRMRCITYARDFNGSFFVIYQLADGGFCRVETSAWDGRYSGFPDGTVVVDIGFVCDTNDYTYITEWFANLKEIEDYFRRKGYRFGKK